ncbi:GAF domain-containing protein [bacterium]|nr:GAF domain-containing protein [bacterium]
MVKKRVEVVSADQPVWFQPEAPLGSAVRHLASLSPRFDWVGIYVLRGKSLVLGPYIGAPTEHRKIPVGTGICGTAVAENRDLNVPDVTQVSNYLACSLATKSELVVLVRDPSGAILGQIDIDSHTSAAFGEQEESWVRQVARELGERWPRE